MSEKTEKPSVKKIRDERKKGNVAKSKEVVNAVTFAGVLFIIICLSDFMISELKKLLETFFTVNLMGSLNEHTAHTILTQGIMTLFKVFLPVGIIIMSLGIVGNLVQTGFLLSTEALKPKIDKLNPVNGFKNMFSKQALITLLKSLMIIVFLGVIGVNFIKNNYFAIINAGNTYTPYLFDAIKQLLLSLIKNIMLGLVVISAIDFAFQKYTHNSQMKMSKEEVKEEYKQQEGDPRVKGQIKQKQKQIASRRMMDAVPTATVILTNPTHLSIALRYEKGIDSAPVVVAKGADIVAMKIREIAKEHDIPIIENKPLARMMYKNIEINQEIPVDMYEIVSEILVRVYKMKNKKYFK